MPMTSFLSAPFFRLLRVSALAMAPAVVAGWALSAQAQPQTQAQPQELVAAPALPGQSTAAGAARRPSGAAGPLPENAHLAVVQERAKARARIHAQRQSTEAAFQQGQAACYQRFAVEDCLNVERGRARKAHALLSQQEAALDGAERRERAAQRLQGIASRTPAPAAPAGTDPASGARNPDISVDALQQERAFEARQRAERLQQKQQLHQAQVAEQVAQRAAAAEKARQRLEEKRAAAERRRARAEQAQQDRAAAGYKPPPALNPQP